MHTLDSDKGGAKNEDVWLDLSDEDHSNWMMFVRPAQNHLEQNLVAYQYGSEIFYTTIKNIQPKQELKVRAPAYSESDAGKPKLHVSPYGDLSRQTSDETKAPCFCFWCYEQTDM